MKKVFIIILCLILTSCAKTPTGVKPTEAPKEKTATKGGTIVLQMREPDSLNPLLTKQNSCLEIYSLIYDNLFYLDENLKPQGNLAEQWAFSEDGLSLTVLMRGGIKWHNGGSLTAGDAAYSINFIKSNDTVFSSRLSMVDSAYAADDSTLIIKLNHQDTAAVSLFTFPIIPLNDSSIDLKPNGTGQFKFVSMQEGKMIELAANKDYHRGEPYLERVDVMFFSSSDKAMSAFTSREVDVLPSSGVNFSRFSVKDYMASKEYNQNSYEFLGLNLEKSNFQSEKVRIALSLAIKRDEIVDSSPVLKFVAANSPIHPKSWLYASEVDMIRQDVTKAKQLLEADGWQLVNNTYSKNGSKFNFNIILNESNSQRLETAKIIAKQLGAVGINVTVEALSDEDYENRLFSKNYDAFIGGAQIGVTGDLGFLLGTNGSSNYFNYSSAFMDLRLQSLLVSATDEQLKDEVRRFMRYFTENQPIIGLYFKNGSVLYNTSIEGISILSDDIYRDVYNWFIKGTNK